MSVTFNKINELIELIANLFLRNIVNLIIFIETD
jgi:hypothetical protein